MEPLDIIRIGERYSSGRGRAIITAENNNPRLRARNNDINFKHGLVHDRLLPLQVEDLKKKIEQNPEVLDAVLEIALYELNLKVPKDDENKEDPEFFSYGCDKYICVGKCTDFITPDEHIEQFTCPFMKANMIVDTYGTEDDFVYAWEHWIKLFNVGENNRELVVPKEWSGQDSDITYVLNGDCFRSFWRKAENRVKAVEYNIELYNALWLITDDIVTRGNAKRQRKHMPIVMQS